MITVIEYDAGYATTKLRCKAFGGRLETHSVRVDDSGDVTVYDPVAGHYTLCHELSERTMARIRKLVAQ